MSRILLLITLSALSFSAISCTNTYHVPRTQTGPGALPSPPALGWEVNRGADATTIAFRN